MARIFGHRNLNEAKRDWSKHVYSFGDLKGNIGRGKVQGYTDNMVITNVTANCQKSALLAIYNGGYRSVSAWLIGNESKNYQLNPGQKLRKLSINPKIGEFSFRWADSDNRSEEVQFPLSAVMLTKQGCFAVVEK